MAWTRTRQHFLALEPARLWRILADLSRLPEWNPAVAAMTPTDGRTGPTRAGDEYRFIPRPPLAGGIIGAVHARTAPPVRVTESEPGAALAWRQAQPGGGMLVRWTLREHDGGTVLQQRVSADGPIAVAAAGAAAGPIAADFAQNAARLYTLAGAAPADDGLKAVIAGGSGFLGRRLAADLLTRGHDVVLLTRRPDPSVPFRQTAWDGRTVGAWARELEAPRQRVAVVNLAGRLVDVRPTQRNIAELRRSRVEPTRALVEASRQHPVDTWIQGSTTAIYGDAGETRLTESSPLPIRTDGSGLGAASAPRALEQMTGVAAPWEEAAVGAAADTLHTLRTSIVLDRGCPAFDRLALLGRAGLGRIGTGRQWFSWIHVDDWLAVVRAALGLTDGVVLPAGPLIAAAPEPVRNEELMALLRTGLAPGPLRSLGVPTPEPLLRVGAAALRSDPALALTGRHATSRVLAEAGFRFEHPALPGALEEILS
ncbi:DUF1731 domain-containing protein [Zhihengliuella sp.]|uniref:DUF1731 domain-containing protein n=1 Tax=Zhihengliuella sp. TaxID=1954483 RepID=UPI0028115FC6|nr:DUF1731 domain-containing protein [Zhihengliuella sp.]